MGFMWAVLEFQLPPCESEATNTRTMQAPPHEEALVALLHGHSRVH